MSDDFWVYTLWWFHAICVLIKLKFLYLHKNICWIFLNTVKKLPGDLWKRIAIWFAFVLTKIPSDCVLCFNVQTSKAVHLFVFIATMFLQGIQYLFTCSISLFIVWTKNSSIWWVSDVEWLFPYQV